MANEIPLLEKGETYIRFICNRLILEGERVRASAVTALAKLAHRKKEFRNTIRNILMKYYLGTQALGRCLVEYADEVRDRAALYLHVLNLEDPQKSTVPALAFGEAAVDVTALENYLNSNKAQLMNGEKPIQIDLALVKSEAPKAPAAKRPEDEEEIKAGAGESPAAAGKAQAAVASKEAADYLEAFKKSSIPENFGEPIYVSPKATLTDSSGEYEVNIVKYMFAGYIVLQFEVRNALADQVIKDVGVTLQLKGTPLQLVNGIKAASIAQGQVGYVYSVLTFDANEVAFPTGTLKAKLEFNVVEIDPTSKAEQGTYPDEYALPDLAISAKDYVKGKQMDHKQFT